MAWRGELYAVSPAAGGEVQQENSGRAEKSLTQRVMERVPSEVQAGGAGGTSTYDGLLRCDEAWKNLRNMKTGEAAGPAPEFVREGLAPLPADATYDVVVCGGTLGIFVATALQLRGHRVAVVERGPLVGRRQEWNISRHELYELVNAGVLTSEEAESCIAIEFNPLRAGFKRYEGDPSGVDTFCDDVLNLGVRPDMLIRASRARLEAAGGTVYENTSITGMLVASNGVSLATPTGEITSRLALDCMGHASPIVRQLRWGQKPDGICLVVGSCARGFEEENNVTGDIIYANKPVSEGRHQYFWEAFPAGSGPRDRTTYMFAYQDADSRRDSLVSMMEDYWRLMPEYQGISSLDELEIQRVLFAFFPTFKASPLPSAWDRICQVGDASGGSSPLSFGGFGALMRHMGRLTTAFDEALADDLLDKGSLSCINAYQPNLSATWMFQRSMSVGVGEDLDPDLIVNLLSNNFKAMSKLGKATLKPFLQDVVQFVPLARTLLGVTFQAPLSIPPLLLHVGLGPLVSWLGHFAAMGAYTAAHHLLRDPLLAALPALSPQDRFKARRLLEAWEVGSGLDYDNTA